MAIKCPYCFEGIEKGPTKCPTCNQYLIDGVIEVDYEGAQKKNCMFCGKSIMAEAKVCKHCHKWFEDVLGEAEQLEDMEGLDDSDL